MRVRQSRPEPIIPEGAKRYFSDPYEWQDFSTGNWEEWRVCSFLRANVLGESEKHTLNLLGLTLEDCFNGRYGAREEPHVHALFDLVNKLLGYDFFKGYK